MGVACGDLDDDGRQDLAVTNFYGESTSLYHSLGQDLFADWTSKVGLRKASLSLLGFGVGFLDFNNDGRLDLVTSNGHINDLRPSVPYAMPPQLLLGVADGLLVDVSDQAGLPFQTRRLGRGLATGDLDNDGRVDVLIVSQNEPLTYLHNRSKGGHFAIFRLEGVSSNRDGVGACLTVTAGGKRRSMQRMGGGSYQSACDPRLFIGLGENRLIESVDVRWPSGRVDRYNHLQVDRGYLIREGDSSPGHLAGFP